MQIFCWFLGLAFFALARHYTKLTSTLVPFSSSTAEWIMFEFGCDHEDKMSRVNERRAVTAQKGPFVGGDSEQDTAGNGQDQTQLTVTRLYPS